MPFTVFLPADAGRGGVASRYCRPAPIRNSPVVEVGDYKGKWAECEGIRSTVRKLVKLRKDIEQVRGEHCINRASERP